MATLLWTAPQIGILNASARKLCHAFVLPTEIALLRNMFCPSWGIANKIAVVDLGFGQFMTYELDFSLKFATQK